MKRKTLILLILIGLVVGLVIAGLFYMYKLQGKIDKPKGVLADSSEILVYKIDDSVTDYGFLAFTFSKTDKGQWFAQGFVDANADGKLSKEEWVIKNKQALVRQTSPHRFGFTLPSAIKKAVPDKVRVRIVLTNTYLKNMSALPEDAGYTLYAPVTVVPVVKQFGLNVPGASEHLKRGLGITFAYADTHDFNAGYDSSNMPDLTGGPMDCFAIAAANNLINMTMAHNRRADIEADPAQLIEELKDLMQWDNGIINKNFKEGKDSYVAEHNLPIETVEIKRPTMDSLENAFANGDAVEISTTMIRSRSGRENTGHVLTGVGAYRNGNSQGVNVHDPATPTGADGYSVTQSGGPNPYLLLNYPMWDGVVFIDAIYVQTWNDTQAESTGVQSTPESEESTTGQTKQSTGDTGKESQGSHIGVEQIVDYPIIETEFEHVKPGEYSEVYAAVTHLTPGTLVNATLNGKERMQEEADENGMVHFTWKIYSYGTYKVRAEAEVEGMPLENTVVVN